MSILCPACKTENTSDATVCTHCAAALPAPQRMSLLEQAMAKPAAMPAAKPVAPPVAQAMPEAAPVSEPDIAKPAYTMPPLPPQPQARRRRSRAPWILAAVLLLALVGALAYEQLQIYGVSLPSLFATRP